MSADRTVREVARPCSDSVSAHRGHRTIPRHLQRHRVGDTPL